MQPNLPFPSGNPNFLIKQCRACGKSVDIEKERFYTLGKEPNREDRISRKRRQRIWFLHPDCFGEVAGSKYL